MEPITLEIIWIAVGIFYGLGQAVIGIVIGRLPEKIDELLPYLKQAERSISLLGNISGITLLTAVGLTIAHAVYQHEPESYIVATVIAISSIFSIRLIPLVLKNYLYSKIASSI